ncbi:winged helix-turn-helix transcriptional regulator [Desulfosporosinus fructosivorans]
MLILRNLLAGPNLLGELRKTIHYISQNVLTDNLRSMEAD